MPHPKRRHTRHRRGNRRAHDSLAAPALRVCPECQARVRPHVACPECGHYRNRKAVEVKEGA